MQRVRRAERRRRQRSGDRGLVYRGAHVYAWVDEARAMLARPPEPEPTTGNAFAAAMAAELYGITRSNVRALSFELGCHDLLADALEGVPVATRLYGLRVWATSPGADPAFSKGDTRP